MSPQLVVFYIVLLSLNWLGQCLGGPVIIRSGIHLGQEDSTRRDEQAANFGVHGRMQLANYEGDDGFNRGDEKHYASAADTGRFGVQDKDVVKHQDAADYQDKAFKQEDGEMINDQGSEKGHKKGHQKSGFHNTYHKDESGSNSSYFDESLDAGDHYNRNLNKGVFADNAQRNQHGHHLTDKAHASGNRRQGQFDNGGHYVKNQGGGGEYARQHYEDNGRVVDNRAAGNAYGEGGRLIREEVVQKTPPQYWNQPYGALPPPPPPVVPIVPPSPYPYRQGPYDSRITIYEDPAYLRHNNYRDYDRYDKPRYYDDRRNDYDYYY